MSFLVNSFQIPNDLVDKLLPQMSPNALKCYLVIVRSTLGWGKEFDAISASKFMEKTGIKKSDTVWVALGELKTLGLIEDVSVPGKPTLFRVITHPNQRDTPKNGSPPQNRVTPTPKKGTTINRGTQKKEEERNKKNNSSSSSPPKMENVTVIFDAYSTLPEEIEGLPRSIVIEEVEAIAKERGGDFEKYRESLVKEILSGGGRTITNIRIRRSRISKREQGEKVQAALQEHGYANIFDYLEDLGHEQKQNV
ncbi:hypothetical protein [Sulfuricurvum sp.]|uniref:hypothetical protein n=1 Tax=Sulfuricurvum sp. TaxID=2025608 RepID=UPI002621EB31|nr:hypothetical protein [Sulfuricurvum sp.]MDD4883061.1 hypothetical protein [Sulfuricurvum sp.]